MSKRLLLTFLSFFLFCTFALATEIRFTWDPNTESDLAGYRLYQSMESGVYVTGEDKAVADIPAGTEVVSIQIMSDGTYLWVLTAYDGQGNESGFSNEVTVDIDTTPPSAPGTLTIGQVINIIINPAQ